MNRPVSCVILLQVFLFQSIVVEADATVVTAVGGSGAFFRSVDSGETWELGGLEPWQCAPTIRHIDWIDEDLGWFAGDKDGAVPTLYKTTNGGESWGWVSLPPIAGSPGHGVRSVDFINADVGWVVGGPNLIFHTTDGGSNWVQQPSGMGSQAVFYDLQFVDENHGWIVGERGVLHTSDGGENWVTQIAGESMISISGSTFSTPRSAGCLATGG